MLLAVPMLLMLLMRMHQRTQKSKASFFLDFKQQQHHDAISSNSSARYMS
jgi:hypothetical protein